MSIEADLIDGDVDDILGDLGREEAQERSKAVMQTYMEALRVSPELMMNHMADMFPAQMKIAPEFPKSSGDSFKWFADTMPVILNPKRSFSVTGV